MGIRSWRKVFLLLLWGACLGLDLRGGLVRAGSFEEGVDFLQGGHYRWALEKFVEAVNRSPRDPQRWWYLAESYRMLGDASAAAGAYRHVLQLSGSSPQAAAARQALEAMGEPSVAMVSVPIQRRGSAIIVPARINGEPVGAFLLDTGATFSSVSSSVAQRLGVRSGSGGTVRLLTASGSIQAPLAILDEVDVGGAVASNVPAVVYDLPGMPPHIVGLLGMSFLERFRVNLDITSGTLILETGR
ncbi:MAG: TIGR02281 family clan AA aspartic protease [candidate division NC10 bacterium]|nr:TIGR02281 family clan AA aspartic protease [candidate division NC10 bacterium]